MLKKNDAEIRYVFRGATVPQIGLLPRIGSFLLKKWKASLPKSAAFVHTHVGILLIELLGLGLGFGFGIVLMDSK